MTMTTGARCDRRIDELLVRQLLQLRGERNSLTAAHDGITEPIVNVRGF